MTEDEANTKACCGPDCCGRFTGDRLPTDKGNGDKLHSLDRVCIGSACMAWRGRVTRGFEAKAEAEFRRTGQRLKPEGHDIEGFCGLAGVLA